MKLSSKTRAALIRAVRTMAATFVGFLVVKWIGPIWPLGGGDIPTISGLIRVVRAHADGAGGTAVASGVVTLGWNRWKPVTPEVGR